jgi:hypothetical protein
VLFIVHTYIIALDTAPTIINETVITGVLPRVLPMYLHIA